MVELDCLLERTEIMVKRTASFSGLQELLEQVSTEETVLALDILRRRSIRLSLDTYPPHLVRIVSNVPEEAVKLFTALLGLRTLQAEEWPERNNGARVHP